MDNKSALQDMLEAQHELNATSNINYDMFFKTLKRPSNPKLVGYCENFRKKLILDYLLAMDQEKAELVDSLDWKWWKKQESDMDNAKIEAVDMLHFLLSIFLILGMDAEEISNLYFKKNKLNHKRQNQGYKDGTYEKVVDGVEDNKELFDEN